MSEKQMAEVSDAGPGSLNDMIGQTSVMAQVAVALSAASADATKFPHAILCGPPGVGKSQTAAIIARAMNTKLHEILGQTIKSAAELNCLLLEVEEDRTIVHIDEAHEIDRVYQTALLYALDQRRVFLQGSKAGAQSIPISDFTLLLSSTDEHRLVQPLRDRMKLVLRFEFYSTEELTAILSQRSRALDWTVDERVLPFIAERSRGTPRLALRLLQACRRVCRAERATEITLDHMRRAFLMEEIDHLGLGRLEQQYLDFLVTGGSALWAIASTLGLPPRTVSLVVEPFLMRQGLVVKDERNRRQLTKKGREHLSRKANS
jgi:Holliday junction DNA helicase RuvB